MDLFIATLFRTFGELLCFKLQRRYIYFPYTYDTESLLFNLFFGGAGEMAQSLKARLTTKNKNLFLDLFIYLLIYECFICIYTCMPEEGIRSLYRWLWATVWLLGIELRTSGRAVSALNRWTISPALVIENLTRQRAFLESKDHLLSNFLPPKIEKQVNKREKHEK